MNVDGTEAMTPDGKRTEERPAKKERVMRGLCCGLAVFAVLVVCAPATSWVLAAHPDSWVWRIAVVAAKAVLAGLLAAGLLCCLEVLESNGRKKKS